MYVSCMCRSLDKNVHKYHSKECRSCEEIVVIHRIAPSDNVSWNAAFAA